MSLIIDFFVSIYEWVLSIFSRVYSWLLGLINDLVDSLFDPLLDLIPNLQPMWDFLSPLQPYTSFVNQWIALDTASTLLTSYFAFIVAMISVKLIVKLFVPTVG